MKNKTKEGKKNSKTLVRHKLLLKKMSENVRNGMTFEQAMLEMGYSSSYAKASTRLKNTKSFQLQLEESLSDDELLKKHRELLNKEEVIIRNNPKTKKIEIIKTGQPHSDVKSALDMSYKLKNKYTPEPPDKYAGWTRQMLIDSILGRIYPDKYRERKRIT